jgi:hypothetical protein
VRLRKMTTKLRAQNGSAFRNEIANIELNYVSMSASVQI